MLMLWNRFFKSLMHQTFFSWFCFPSGFAFARFCFRMVLLSVCFWAIYSFLEIRNISFGIRNISWGIRSISLTIRNISFGIRNISWGIRNISLTIRNISARPCLWPFVAQTSFVTICRPGRVFMVITPISQTSVSIFVQFENPSCQLLRGACFELIEAYWLVIRYSYVSST